MQRTRLRSWSRIVFAAGAAMITVSLISLPAHADDGSSGDIGISVPVIGTTAPPVGGSDTGNNGSGSTGSGSTGGSGRGSSSSSGSATTPDASVATDTAGPEPAATDILIAGGLYLGDINGSSRPTLNPFEGKADLWVTLRNLSTETITASAEFSIVSVFGSPIADSRVAVTDLKPGETRVVGTTLSGTGQWPLVTGRVTVDPPDVIAGQQTAPVTRETVVFVLPWLGLIGLVLVGLAVVLLRLSARVVSPAAPAASGVA